MDECNSESWSSFSRIVATSTQSTNAHTHSSEARIIGSAFAGVSELILFHPVDTVAKRLMSNRGQIMRSTFPETLSNLDTVIFKDASSKGLTRKYLSLFPGIGWGGAYKILQRIYKFGGQPFVKDYFTKTPSISNFFEQSFGEKQAKPMMHATAGSLIGIGEIVLLPLDVLKIKAQTNPQSIAGRGIIDIFTKERMNLYRGAGWTAARNAPGSFALFGGAAFAKEHIFHLEHYGQATWFQDFISSIIGAMSSITVAAPLDVVKTRLQSHAFEKQRDSGVTIIRNMVLHEGIGSFFKGLVPKLVVVGPKLIFSFTVAQHAISYFDAKFIGEKS